MCVHDTGLKSNDEIEISVKIWKMHSSINNNQVLSYCAIQYIQGLTG